MGDSFYSPDHYSLNCKTGKGRNYREKQVFARTRFICPKHARQRSAMSSVFCWTRDYLCPPDSPATRPITVASVPIQGMPSAVRQNGAFIDFGRYVQANVDERPNVWQLLPF